MSNTANAVGAFIEIIDVVERHNTSAVTGRTDEEIARKLIAFTDHKLPFWMKHFPQVNSPLECSRQEWMILIDIARKYFAEIDNAQSIRAERDLLRTALQEVIKAGTVLYYDVDTTQLSALKQWADVKNKYIPLWFESKKGESKS